MKISIETLISRIVLKEANWKHDPMPEGDTVFRGDDNSNTKPYAGMFFSKDRDIAGIYGDVKEYSIRRGLNVFHVPPNKSEFMDELSVSPKGMDGGYSMENIRKVAKFYGLTIPDGVDVISLEKEGSDPDDRRSEIMIIDPKNISEVGL